VAKRKKDSPVAEASDGRAAEAAAGLLESVVLRLDWMDPADLAAHPENVREHGDEQMAALAESIDAAGWAKPLIFNESTGRLVDGHARLRHALAQGLASVPVNVGRWTEDQERLLLASLDAIGAQARIDPRRFAELREKLDTSGIATGFAALDRLHRAMATDPFFLRGAGQPARMNGQAPAPSFPLPLDAEPDDGPGEDDEGADGPGPGPFAPPASHVRMVQLFLDTETLPPFQARVAELSARYGTTNPTDTVIEALRREADRAD
jgi:hypothetical protein